MANIPKAAAKEIIYIGGDKGYWSTIESRFKSSYPVASFNFTTLYEKNDDKVQCLFLDILKLRPKIVYIDFSIRIQPHLRIAQMIKRDNTLGDTIVVALIDKKEAVRSCTCAGADFVHIKCGEYHDVIFDPFLLAYPKEVKKPDFAKAKTAVDVKLINDFRVGYISATSLHIEGNLEMEVGQVVTVESTIPTKISSSKNFIVKSVMRSDLYYDYKYAYDLEFVCVDEPEFSESEHDDALGETDEKARLKQIKDAKKNRQFKIQDYKNELELSKKRLKEWVNNKSDNSKQKKNKILIVDQSMRILLDPELKPLDKFSFGIRCQTTLSGPLSEIDILLPKIIILQCFGKIVDKKEDDQEASELELYKAYTKMKRKGTIALPEIAEGEKHSEQDLAAAEIGQKDLEQIGHIIDKIKSIENYVPFIIIFNCFFKTSKALQEGFQYPTLITHKDNVDMGTVIHMATMLQEKQDKKIEDRISKKIMELKRKDPGKYRKLTTGDFIEPRYYISKTNDLSYAAVKYSATVISLTESTITFTTEQLLELSTYRMNFPVKMSIRIIASEGKAFSDVGGGLKQYTALIHSVGEDDKKEIRRMINDVFFEPLNEKRQKETEGYHERHKKAQEHREVEEEDQKKEAAEQMNQTKKASDNPDDSNTP